MKTTDLLVSPYETQSLANTNHQNLIQNIMDTSPHYLSHLHTVRWA
jgi:hypothetical protein